MTQDDQTEFEAGAQHADQQARARRRRSARGINKLKRDLANAERKLAAVELMWGYHGARLARHWREVLAWGERFAKDAAPRAH